MLGYCARFIGNSKLKWVDVKMQIIIWARHFIHIKCNWSTIISLRIYVLHPGNIKIVYAISFVTLPFHIYCFGFEIKIEDVCTRRRKRTCSHDKSCNKLMQRGKQLNLFYVMPPALKFMYNRIHPQICGLSAFRTQYHTLLFLSLLSRSRYLLR